ncbi:MAG: sulfotransferase [Thermomonas sp.]|uniref:tetratricopeptide repeat-containing sulfotransferase family protein n=1 Tax=Thermomonas sp. TaxID=1971895 RepID=UPI0025EC9CB4|nr:tetratricopeptide repeat-containing sulfotransferase family protein [Thermomonas sp.]MBK6923936.1 sulfotransferase [Thermomonas sp.]
MSGLIDVTGTTAGHDLRRVGQDALRVAVQSALDRQDWAAAVPGLRESLRRAPADAASWIQLSYAESFLGHYRGARTAALSAAGCRVASAGVAADVTARLRTFNEARALRDYLGLIGPPSRMPIPLLLAAAAQSSYLNEQTSALLLLDEARRADPDYPSTLIARAQVLTYLGRFAEAESELDRSQRRAPQIALGWLVRANLRRQTKDANHVAVIRAQLAKPGRSPADVAYLALALHKELDDLGEHDAAWTALEQACGAKRSLLKYDVADSRDLVDMLVASPVPPVLPRADDGAARVPVFIVGMHRSGTTLLEQLLDGSPQVHGVGELYDFTSAMRYATDHHCKGVIDRTIVERAGDVDFGEVGQRYLDGMAWRLGDERCFTDKLPSNFLNIGFICRALPQARILHMVRDPVETCFSNLRELFSDANPYSYDQRELADYYLQYRRLMAHWHAAYPGRILDVDYAELTRDPAGVMRMVAAFCGIDYLDAMSDPRSSGRAVATASAVQVRDRVVRRDVPKWAPYAKHLQPLVAALRQGGVEVPELPA